MIAAFIAVLEMVRMQAVVLNQKTLFGEIYLRKTRQFEAAFDAYRAERAAAPGTEIDGQYA
jgi:chromatin segregation and condensation protein Rec8/ScpA/Scc1 (kleisin family)